MLPIPWNGGGGDQGLVLMCLLLVDCRILDVSRAVLKPQEGYFRVCHVGTKRILKERMKLPSEQMLRYFTKLKYILFN